MASELLLETIAMLKQRISIRGDYLARNEVPTRQMLVDPLLRALGWDFEDTDRVSLEHPVRQGRIDYALRLDGVSMVAIEAKRLGTDLGDQVRLQAYRYAIQGGIKYAVMTDGNRWAMFDASIDPRLPGSALLDVVISEVEPSEGSAQIDRMSYRSIEGEIWLRFPI